MAIPTPTLKQSGKQALEEFLQQTNKDHKVPAVSLGVTNKDGELWFGCGGERVFGQPNEGQINDETGASGFGFMLSRAGADKRQYSSSSP